MGHPHQLQLTGAQRRRIEAAFLRSLDEDATLPFQTGQLDLFTDEEETYVRQEVERLLYEPKLPNAGNRERHWLKRLRGFLEDESLVVGVVQLCRETVTAFEALLPRQEFIRRGKDTVTLPGCYYIRKALTPKVAGAKFKMLMTLRQEAVANKEWGKKWLADFLIEGLPEAVSNFKLECVYLLRGQDGNVTRLVRLINVLGEVSEGRESGGTDVLPSDAFASAEKFRAWCLSKGNFNWGVGGGAGNIELQMLHADVSHSSAYRVVKLVEWVGWYPTRGRLGEKGGHPNGLWFYDECAFANGEIVLPEREAIGYDGAQYVLGRKGREAEFTHGRPAMKPWVTLTGEEPWLGQFGDEVERVELDTSDWEEVSRGMPVLSGFFREICRRFYETAGGPGGWMAVGAVLGYAAGPEFFERHGALPSIFIPGEMGSGKTVFTGWLMSLFGYENAKGMGLGKGGRVTPVGLCQQLENYSSIGLWFDEFRQWEISDEKIAIIRDAYDRQLAGKWTPDGIQRVIRTTPLVSGESSTQDAATRSRYIHLQLAKEQRIANHLDWMRAHRGRFFLIWREIMRRRHEFAALTMDLVGKWLEHAGTQLIHERTRLAHALSYAAFCAATALLESHGGDELNAFRRFMVEQATAAAVDVRSEVNVNVFMQDVITAFKDGEIPPEYFRVETELTFLPDAPEQGEWESVTLWLDADSVLSALKKFLASRRELVALKRKDIRDQLSKHDFWAGATNKRYKSGTAYSWGIKLDLHPLGRIKVTNDVFGAALSGDRDFREFAPNFTPAFRDGDPRKGPLYAIADGVRRWQAEERRQHE